MRVTFLGTGSGSTLTSRRFKAGILIETRESSVLLDLGTGVNYRLDETRYPEAIFITHLHADHFLGLPDHLVARSMRGVSPPKVYSPYGILRVLENIYSLGTGEVFPLPVREGIVSTVVGDIEVYSVEACHVVDAYGYVVRDRRHTVLYSGDTSEPCEGIMREARGADLVIHEVSCLKGCEQRYGHTSVETIKSLPVPASKVVATHIPTQEEADIVRHLEGYRVAHDLMELTLGE